MRYDALLKKLKTLEERYESEVSHVLQDFAQRDTDTRQRILAKGAKPLKWQQTPEGRKTLRRAMKKRWKLKKKGMA